MRQASHFISFSSTRLINSLNMSTHVRFSISMDDRPLTLCLLAATFAVANNHCKGF